MSIFLNTSLIDETGIAMSLNSWEEYVKSNILKFRAQYETSVSGEDKRLVMKNREIFYYSLSKPCQIVVVDFLKTYPKCFIILHGEERSDMETRVVEMPFENLSADALKEIEELTSISLEETQKIVTSMQDMRTRMEEWGALMGDWKFFGNSSVVFERRDFRTMADPFEFSKWQIKHIKNEISRISREKGIDKIEETVGIIKRDAKEIPIVELRTKIIEASQRLEGEIISLRKKVDEEIGGVRKMIGDTKEFQDFKVFTTDVSDLKKSHVPREVFDAKVSELGTRIDSLSEVKEAYDKVLEQQNEFMKQQADVMKQQSSFVTWIKYSSVLVPIAVVSAPIIYALLRHFLGIP